MTTQTPTSDPPHLIARRLEAEVLEKMDGEDYRTAVALCRPLVAITSLTYGPGCIIAVRAVAMLALALDYVEESRREADTWAHVAFLAFVELLMVDEGPYIALVSHGMISGHISILREVFPEVWDRRDTFKRAGVPDFETGALIPFQG